MGAIIKQTSCVSRHDPEALSFQAALDTILERIQPVGRTETIPLRDAAGRVLAEAPRSPINVPGRTNSAMDGYAIIGGDVPHSGEARLKLVGTSLAGQPHAGDVAPGECVRITTGAAMPAACDTVVMQEHVRPDGGYIVIDHENQAGQNVRQAGEDVARGAIMLEPGRRLTPADVGLLASTGLTQVQVHCKPRVGFFSTGKEIIATGQRVEDYQLYDSNRHTLHAMLAPHPVERTDLGIVDDQYKTIRSTLLRAAETCDLILSSGGASVGDTDHVVALIRELGELHFHKIAVKPGRPLCLGTLTRNGHAAPYLALPGNPVSVMATFYCFVQPAITRLSGGQYTPPLRLAAQCADNLKKRAGRLELQRGILSCNNGRHMVERTGAQGSGILTSMSRANCFIVLDEDCDGVRRGDEVEVIPFYGLL